MFKHGILTVSLDFELFWGVRDKLTLENYGAAIAGVRQAVPRLLELFTKYEIHATWAAVGFLYFRDLEELCRNAPSIRPEYADDSLNPYSYVRSPACREVEPHYLFAPDLIQAIAGAANQELATHTFSHYYCLEPGQTVEQFRSDLQAAIQVEEQRAGRRPESLIFPRNQFNPEYLHVCADLGIRCYRGNQDARVYEAGCHRENTAPLRALRLLDSYVNVTGHHGYSLEDLRRRARGEPVDVPASMILRSWSRPLRRLEPLKARRIQASLSWCARRLLLYHLWWHPHNFGVDQEENFGQLEVILGHFHALRARYGMQSLTMAEVAEAIACERSR